MFLLQFSIVILLVLTGRWAAFRLKQPPVLGELMAGLVYANIFSHFGPVLRQTTSHSLLGSFGELGLILMLFMLGMETDIRAMLRVGKNALQVAIAGVVAPFGLALLVGQLLLKYDSMTTHLFLGATLCATSIGITARVFQDLKKTDLPESRLILGAAVIDDVLGLIILSVVSGVASSGSIGLLPIFKVLFLSAFFIGVIAYFGDKIAKFLADKLSPLDWPSSRLFVPLLICLVFAWVAEEIGLAAIVGAFAAGLVVQEEFFAGPSAGNRSVAQWLQPIESFLAPVFFVLIGLQVDLSTLTDIHVVLLTVALVIAAVIGKLACGLFAGKGYDKLSVGIGMLPRGEVGLIFAAAGKNLNVLSPQAFSALVIMIIVTTVITPPALNWSLRRVHR